MASIVKLDLFMIEETHMHGDQYYRSLIHLEDRVYQKKSYAYVHDMMNYIQEKVFDQAKYQRLLTYNPYFQYKALDIELTFTTRELPYITDDIQMSTTCVLIQLDQQVEGQATQATQAKSKTSSKI